MSLPKPISFSTKLLRPTQTNPNSRSLIPYQRRTPSPPHPPPSNNHSRNVTSPQNENPETREKRYRTRSPDHSPARKYYRRSPSHPRSPPFGPNPRHYPSLPDHRPHSLDRYHPYPPRHTRSDPYDHHDRFDRYSPSHRRQTRGRDPDRDRDHHHDRDRDHDPDSRRRYYSPQPRSPPPRYPPSSRQPHLSRDSQPYRPAYRDDAYRDRNYQPPRSRVSDRSSSRSPRRRRDRRRRERRLRHREPVSPSQRMPADQVDKLFLEALKLVLRYRRPPFNISVISDYMSSIDHQWSVRNTQYPTFSDLCRLQESRHHLVLARQGESVVLQSSKYEPDVLEERPKDVGRRKRNRDTDRPRNGANHIDTTNRREWDLDERVEARKKRFRQNGDEKHPNTNVVHDPKRAKERDIGEGATAALPEQDKDGQIKASHTEGGTDHAEKSTNGDMNGLEVTGATTVQKADQVGLVRPQPPRARAETSNGIDRSRDTVEGIENAKTAEEKSVEILPPSSGNKQEGPTSEALPTGAREKKGDSGDEREGKPSDGKETDGDLMPTSAVDLPVDH